MNESDNISADPLIGTMIGNHFQLLSCLGRGGMSVVYKAKDLLLHRIVAVKILRPHSSLVQRNVMRFRQEAIAALRMDHPNIIRVFEFDIPEAGEPYLVMELLEGQSLAEMIETNGAIELTRAISIMRGICAGLQHAHESGILHRDLKPANIMLMRDTKQSIVKLFDFGIAKLLVEDDQSQALTQTGDFVGSPLYMSPEQIASEKLDERSDVYALGCVMYEMVTGKPPFRGSNLLETMQMQVSAVASPVNEVYPGIKNADRIESVLLKAMAKQRDQRYQTVAEFADAIQSISRSSNKGFVDRAKTKLEIRKNKSTAGKKDQVSKLSLIVSSGAILIAALSLLSTNLASHLPRATDLVTSGSAPVMKRSNEAPEATWTRLDLDAQNCVNIGDYAKAQKVYSECYKIAQSSGTEYLLATLEGMRDLSALTGKDTKNIDHEIDKIAHESINTDVLIKNLHEVRDKAQLESMIDAAERQANLLSYSGRPGDAKRLMSAALRAGKPYFGPGDEIEARCLLTLANSYRIYMLDQRTSPELKDRITAYAILRKHPQTELFQDCAFTIGRYYNTFSQPDKAVPFLKQALDAAKTVFGYRSKPVAKCLFQLAFAYGTLGQQALSDTCAHESLLVLGSLKPEQLDAEAFYVLGSVESILNKKDEALRDFRRSLQEYERGPEKNYPLIAHCCGQVAASLPMKSPEAQTIMMRKLTILNRIGVLAALEECAIYELLARRYRATNQLEKERDVLQRAVDLISKSPLPYNNSEFKNVIYCAKYLAEAQLAKNDIVDAEKNALLFQSWARHVYGSKSSASAAADALLGKVYLNSHHLKEAQ